MVAHINPKMMNECLEILGRVPGFSKQATDVGSQHGAGVIQ